MRMGLYRDEAWIRDQGLLAVVLGVAVLQLFGWPLLGDPAPGWMLVGMALALVAPAASSAVAGAVAGRRAWWICGAPVLVFLLGNDWAVSGLLGRVAPWLLGLLMGWAVWARRREHLPMSAPVANPAPPRLPGAPASSPGRRIAAPVAVALVLVVTSPIVAVAWLNGGGGTGLSDIVGVLLTWAMLAVPLFLAYVAVSAWRARRAGERARLGRREG